MRYLNTDEELEIEESKAKDAEINQELIDLGNRITENTTAISQTNDRIDALETTDTIQKTNGNFTNVTASNIDTIQLNTETVDADNVDAKNGNFSVSLESPKIETDDFKTKTANVTTKLTTPEIETTTISTGTITGTSATFDTVTFDNAAIDNATIENFDIEHLSTESANIPEIETDELTVNTEVTSPKATLDDVTAEFIQSEQNLLERLQTHNITYDNELSDERTEPYYIHIEPQDQPSTTDYRIIEIPYTDTGDYFLSLRDPVTDISWWSVIIRNNHSNITMSYSRRTTDLTGEPLTNPTLSEAYIYDYDSVAPRLYLKTYVGGNLYWQNHSLRKNPEVSMYNEYPFDISSQGALRYQILHTAATWFSHHIDLMNGQSADKASLLLIPSDWNNATKQQLEYNTMRDIPYRYYIPDQSVNTTDEVTFKDLVIEPLEGRWVYNVENALKGRDGVTIVHPRTSEAEAEAEFGQLNAYPWVIQTDELVKWNGKVGVKVDNITSITGTIYRDQAWEKINDYLYRKVDIDTYDTCAYETSSSVTNVLVLRRKKDTERGDKEDLVVSAPYVLSEYEDPDGFVWDCYTYTFYGEYPEGLMYTKWIERTTPGGEVISRVLESTVDSEEYIQNTVLFKEEFTTGTVNLDLFSFEDYKKEMAYLSNVQEGTWNAGDVHVTRKNVDTHSEDHQTTEPFDYSGSLTVDYKTELRNDILIQNRFDPEDIKNVENIETHVDAVTTDVADSVTTTIGSAQDPATVSTTVYGTESYTHVGDEGKLVTGDVTETITGDVTKTLTGDLNETITGDVDVQLDGSKTESFTGTTTITGSSDKAYHNRDASDPDEATDWNYSVKENVIVGTDADNRDLKVTGRLYTNELELDVDEHKILWYQANKLHAVDRSFIGTASEYTALATKPVDGSLVIEV